MKTTIIFFCTLFVSLNIIAKPATIHPDEQFDKFVSGALEVYSDFKTPSKAESERFYTFIQKSWQNADCSTNCSSQGYSAAKTYAQLLKIETKSLLNGSK